MELSWLALLQFSLGYRARKFLSKVLNTTGHLSEMEGKAYGGVELKFH
jgi:hypothetical protein